MRWCPLHVTGLLGVKNRKPHSVNQKGSRHLVILEGRRVREETGAARSDGDPALTWLACAHHPPMDPSIILALKLKQIMEGELVLY